VPDLRSSLHGHEQGAADVSGRLPGFAAASLVATVALAGCGKSSLRAPSDGSDSKPVVGHVAAPAQHAPRVRDSEADVPSLPDTAANRRRARSFVQGVAIVRADVPGASAAPPEGEQHSETNEKCFGVTAKAQPVLARGNSQRLVRGRDLTRETLSSAVTVEQSSREASEAVRFVLSSQGRACYAQILQRQLGSEHSSGVQVGELKLKLLPTPLARASFGLRISATIRTRDGGLALHIYSDLLGFAIGQSEVTLQTTSVIEPVATKTEQELLTVLLERAQARPL
jgi:hypothetical protein